MSRDLELAHQVLELARISHHLATANRDLPQSAAFPPIGLLNILRSMPPLPSSRRYHISRHLSVLATRRGEICGQEAAAISTLIVSFGEPFVQVLHLDDLWGVDLF